MPDYRPSAVDNLILDGYWAHQGRDLSELGVDVYPPLCFLQMELVFKPLRWWFSVGEAPPPVIVSGTYVIAARAISALLTLGSALLVFLIGREFANRLIGGWAAFLYLLNPTTLYYAHTTNTEATYVFYTILAVFFWVKATKVPDRARWILLFGIAAALAVLAKDQAAFVLIGPGLWLLWKRPKIALAGGALSAMVWFGGFVLWNGPRHLVRHVQAMRSTSVKFEEYGLGLLDLIKLSADVACHVWLCWGLALVLAAVAAWYFRKDEDWRQAARLLGLMFVPYYLAVLFLAHHSWVRYLLPLLPVVAVQGAWLLANWSRTRRQQVLLAAVALAQLVWGLGLPFYLSHSPRDVSKAFLRTHQRTGRIPPDARVGMFTKHPFTAWYHTTDGELKTKVKVRDWQLEEYGWISDRTMVVTMRSDRPGQLYEVAPELLLVFDGEPVPAPIDGYQEIARFKSSGLFEGLYGSLIRHPEVTIYVRTFDLEM